MLGERLKHFFSVLCREISHEMSFKENIVRRKEKSITEEYKLISVNSTLLFIHFMIFVCNRSIKIVMCCNFISHLNNLQMDMNFQLFKSGTPPYLNIRPYANQRHH